MISSLQRTVDQSKGILYLLVGGQAVIISPRLQSIPGVLKLLGVLEPQGVLELEGVLELQGVQWALCRGS